MIFEVCAGTLRQSALCEWFAVAAVLVLILVFVIARELTKKGGES